MYYSDYVIIIEYFLIQIGNQSQFLQLIIFKIFSQQLYSCISYNSIFGSIMESNNLRLEIMVLKDQEMYPKNCKYYKNFIYLRNYCQCSSRKYCLFNYLFLRKLKEPDESSFCTYFHHQQQANQQKRARSIKIEVQMNFLKYMQFLLYLDRIWRSL
ncbi:unnamed protein product [Paramecium pentaurelia]|uniref:Uncharacterized protein n=1 Tax=Paramecium pentaurelia TaxID=43138 RepID=A0A8S1WGP4_9CILI|nr:unnamed protein product [Paramecium pentaurelia]